MTTELVIEAELNRINGTDNTQMLDTFLVGYVLITFFFVLALFTQGMVSAKATLSAARRMHERLLARVLNAPIWFFVRDWTRVDACRVTLVGCSFSRRAMCMCVSCALRPLGRTKRPWAAS